MLRRAASGTDIANVAGLAGSMRRSSSSSSMPSSMHVSVLPRRLSESTPDLRAHRPDSGLESIPELSSTTAATRTRISTRKSLLLICMLSVIDGMDIQLLPASFKALESDLGLKPTDLALLAVCQGYAMCISGPFWGSIADHGFPRKWLLAAGSAMWGTLTLLLALCDSFHVMVVLRTLNGVALGLLTPVIQSFIAEVSAKTEMGFSFGCIDFCQLAVGQVLALITISSVAEREMFGLKGWRVAFMAVAGMSIAMAIPIVVCIEERPRQWRPEGVGILSEFQKFLNYMRMPTFLVLIAQGIFGTIPGSAMSFTTMYFQYIGIGSLAGMVSAFKILGTGIGSVLGGFIGDFISARSPLHGRVLTAQLSVAISIPLAASVFLIVPASSEYWPLHMGLLFLLGIVHWCSSGCNRPILVELVAPDCVGSVFAWQNCVEHMSGFIFGPVGVALLSELCFDYVPAKKDSSTMPEWERQANAAALGNSLAVCTALPWTVCFFLYGFMHVTYPAEAKGIAVAGAAAGAIAVGPSELTPLTRGPGGRGRLPKGQPG